LDLVLQNFHCCIPYLMLSQKLVELTVI
jgi:hypothetical protein